MGQRDDKSTTRKNGMKEIDPTYLWRVHSKRLDGWLSNYGPWRKEMNQTYLAGNWMDSDNFSQVEFKYFKRASRP
jgi:hypothetical protein